jgi:hypothetical protein
LSESNLIKSSVTKYIDGNSDSAVPLRRLYRIDKAIARHQRDDDFHAEAFAVPVSARKERGAVTWPIASRNIRAR